MFSMFSMSKSLLMSILFQFSRIKGTGKSLQVKTEPRFSSSGSFGSSVSTSAKISNSRLDSFSEIPEGGAM